MVYKVINTFLRGYKHIKMTSKRKHITLTIKQKSDVLERLARGESGKVLANEYGVGTSTISDIKKQTEI